MKIATIHFHLNRGGVTQVILNHLLSLNSVVSEADSVEVALVYGGRREGWPEAFAAAMPNLRVQLVEVQGLDYDDGEAAQPKILSDRLRAALMRAGFTRDKTILHIHNHALGKNVSLPGAIQKLADDGFRLLLQIHDFAEDFRPDNYCRLADSHPALNSDGLANLLYPQSASVHYAVLNQRDYGILVNAGFDTDRIHRLPNPVQPFGELPDKTVARRRLLDGLGVSPSSHFVLYPVRAIRRKNLGEALLWSAAVGKESTCAITLSPLNPLERPSYEAWTQFSQQLDLPFMFDIGKAGGLTYLDNLAAADQIITTSVAEGFGMVFLEAWLAGCTLVGRNLPEITADFVEAGLNLNQLYSRLAIPIAWAGADSFERDIRRAYHSTMTAYRRPTSNWEAVRGRLIQDEMVDFPQLSSRLQRHVIQTVWRDDGYRRELRELNPLFADPSPDVSQYASLVQANAQVARSAFSLPTTGKRLVSLYQKVLASSTGGPLTEPARSGAILDYFLDVCRIHPVRFQE